MASVYTNSETALGTRTSEQYGSSICNSLFFSCPRLVAHEKRSARHPDSGSARGAVCLDLPQACDRAVALLGRWLDSRPGALCRSARFRGIELGTRPGRQPEYQRLDPFRTVFLFLRFR